MSSTTALIVRNDRALSAETTPDAVQLRDDLISESAMIGVVQSPSDNEHANLAMVSITTYLSRFEQARQAAKAPIIDFGRAIDQMASAHIEPLKVEQARISKLLGDYHTAERARQKAAEAAEKAELARLDRERQAALAEAQTHEERDLINSRKDEEVKAAAPAVVVEKPKGQKVDEEWVFEVHNPHLLAQKHPELVRRIDFDSKAVKTALDILGSLPGVSARKEVVVTARAVPQRKVL